MSASNDQQFTRIAPYYDHLMRHVPYDMWVDYCEKIADQENTDVRDVLDLCCGTGSVTVRLAKRGYRAVGVDYSADMAQLGMALSGAQDVGAQFAVADARKLCFERAFDLVVCLFDSLNYITEDQGVRDCFAGVARALRQRGLFLFDMNTIRALKLGLFTQTNHDTLDPLKYNWRSSWDSPSRVCTVRMDFEYETGGYSEVFEEVHRQKGYTFKEIESWLQEAGMECCHIYNAHTFRNAGMFANRVFVVARKARTTL